MCHIHTNITALRLSKIDLSVVLCQFKPFYEKKQLALIPEFRRLLHAHPLYKAGEKGKKYFDFTVLIMESMRNITRSDVSFYKKILHRSKNFNCNGESIIAPYQYYKFIHACTSVNLPLPESNDFTQVYLEPHSITCTQQVGRTLFQLKLPTTECYKKVTRIQLNKMFFFQTASGIEMIKSAMAIPNEEICHCPWEQFLSGIINWLIINNHSSEAAFPYNPGEACRSTSIAKIAFSVRTHTQNAFDLQAQNIPGNYNLSDLVVDGQCSLPGALICFVRHRRLYLAAFSRTAMFCPQMAEAPFPIAHSDITKISRSIFKLNFVRLLYNRLSAKSARKRKATDIC